MISMIKYEYIVCLLIVITNFFDGIRDTNINRSSGVPWLKWHIVKWLSSWPLWIFIAVYFLSIPEIVFTGIISKIAFKAGYQISLKHKVE